MAEIRYYVAASGAEPFAEWFVALEAVARAKVTRAIARREQGNFSNAKGAGEGVLEYRIDFGPGIESISGATATRW
jgi:putative addiction module killer protein